MNNLKYAYDEYDESDFDDFDSNDANSGATGYSRTKKRRLKSDGSDEEEAFTIEDVMKDCIPIEEPDVFPEDELFEVCTPAIEKDDHSRKEMLEKYDSIRDQAGFRQKIEYRDFSSYKEEQYDDYARQRERDGKYDDYDRRGERDGQYGDYDRQREREDQYDDYDRRGERDERDGYDRYREDQYDENGPYRDERPYGDESVSTGRTRKIRKKKHYFLRFLVCVSVIAAGYFILTSNVFEIQKIKVINNTHYSNEEIIEMSGIKNGSNMFKIKAGEIEDSLENDPYVKNANIKRKPLHTIEIEMEEREVQFYIQNEDMYVGVDFDGIVLSEVEEVPTVDDVPSVAVVKNIEIEKAKLGSTIKVKQNRLLDDTITLATAIEENDMFFQTIEMSDVTVKAYLNENFLCSGKIKDIAGNIGEIIRVIEDLQINEISRGTIIVSGNGTCTFTPEIR